MTSIVDWSFFNTNDPLISCENACSFISPIDAFTETIIGNDDDVRNGCMNNYTTTTYTPMRPLFNAALPTTNEYSMDPWNSLSQPMPPLSPTTNPTFNPFDTNDFFMRDISPTPSLCADGQSFSTTVPLPLKRTLSAYSSPSPTSNSSSDEEDKAHPSPKRTKRRASVRPNSTRTPTPPSTIPNATRQEQQRVPHNQVERKYREGLNMQLEQLRRAVPTLCHMQDGERGKPSKATVLVGAIAYIKQIERERDTLVEEVRRKGGVHWEDGSVVLG